MYTNPSVSDFKNFFVRDFPYGTDITTSVTDGDITTAMEEASATINQGLFCAQSTYNLGFYYLSAHDLVMNLRASSQGISGKYEWLQNSKSVGNVSEGLAIPDRILGDPLFSMYSQTFYGIKYLGMIFPQLCGQMFAVAGDTLP